MKRITIPVLIILFLFSGCFLCPHKNVSDPTCTQDGICQLCEEVIIPATGHKEGPTRCEEDTLCSICGVVLKAALPHAPGPEATCTQEQVCLSCGEVLAPVTEHTPSGEPGCLEDVVCTGCSVVLVPAAHEPGETSCIDEQLCLRCGEVLGAPTGHTLSGSECGVCGVTMVLDENSPEGSYIHETVSGGHYNNYLDAYYSGYVLVCGDYALEFFTLSSSGNEVWAQAVNNFADRFPDVQVSAMLVPKSCAYHSPADFPDSGGSQRAYAAATYSMLNDNVIAVDAMAVMDQHSEEYMYYRTDHHWAPLGAYYASVAFCRANGITPRQLGSYETIVQPGYIGTMYYFADGYEYTLLENPDYTVYHLPEAECSMTILNEGYAYEAPMMNTDTSDYASGFLYGDNPISIISTDNQTGRNLLIFKESFGNCYAPFMADYFDTVVVADMRYFFTSVDSIDTLVNDYGITHSLIMNNMMAVDDFAEMLYNVLDY